MQDLMDYSQEDAMRRRKKAGDLGTIQQQVNENLAPAQMRASSPGVQLHESSPAVAIEESLPSMKHGGEVKHTGMYKLHKGEHVLTSQMAKQFRKASR
jgi:hypothetical protein